MLQTLREHSPTAFDHSEAGWLPEQAEWIVLPVIRTRDSGPLDESNFRTAVKAMGGESDKVQVHSFGHWACGWYEILICAPEYREQAEEIDASLENYPVLDDDDYSREEWDRASSYWQGMGMRERIEWCGRYDVSIFAARRDEVPEDPRGELVSRLAE